MQRRNAGLGVMLDFGVIARENVCILYLLLTAVKYATILMNYVIYIDETLKSLPASGVWRNVLGAALALFVPVDGGIKPTSAVTAIELVCRWDVEWPNRRR
jgi:hypothetical protein